MRDDYKLTPGLVLVGAPGWLSDDVYTLVDKFDLRSDTFFLGRVDALTLRYLYNAAQCLVHPAFYEGFGLTPLEAMACGTPVIVSNISSLPEVVGDAALLVNPESDDEITVALWRLLTDQALRASLRAKGLQRAAAFSWSRAAEQTMTVYRMAASCDSTASRLVLSDRYPMARILILTPQLPIPPQALTGTSQGTTIRNYNLIAGLAKRHTIDLASFRAPDDPAGESAEQAAALAALSGHCRRMVVAEQPVRSSGSPCIRHVAQPPAGHGFAACVTGDARADAPLVARGPRRV